MKRLVNEKEGLLHDLVYYIEKTSYIPNRMVAFCGALSCMSYLMGARYRTPDDVYPGLYSVLVGKSGSGKDAAFKSIRNIVKQVVSAKFQKDQKIALLSKGITQKVSTFQGIHDKLAVMDERPDILIEADEIGTFIQASLRGSNDHARAFTSFLVEAYHTDSIHFRDLSSNGNKNQRIIDSVDYPSITVVGASNMMSLSNGVSVEQIFDGFINRFLWFPIDDHSNGINRNLRKHSVDGKVLKKLAKIATVVGTASSMTRHMDHCTVIEYESGANDVFMDYDSMIRSGDMQEKELAFRTRISLQAKKIACIIAVSKNHKKPVIYVADAKKALSFAIWLCDQAIELLTEHVVDANVNRVVDEMKEWLDLEVSAGCGVSLMSLFKVSSYHEANRSLKAEMRDEFYQRYGDEYGTVKVPTARRGPKTTLIFKRGEDGLLGKTKRFKVFKPTGAVEEIKLNKELRNRVNLMIS